jgi:phospholipid transport system substrate-binding protein
VVVPVEILRPGSQPPVVLNWKLQGASAGLRIRDVSISGVSMAVTYRDEFASVVQRSNGKVAVLIAALREKAGDK